MVAEAAMDRAMCTGCRRHWALGAAIFALPLEKYWLFYMCELELDWLDMRTCYNQPTYQI